MVEDSNNWPSRPITFLGSNQHLVTPKETAHTEGPLMITYRRIAQGVSDILGQEVNVEQVFGRDKWAPRIIADAKPDGYTFGSLGFGRPWQMQFIKLPFDMATDFSYVAHVWSFNLFWVVRPDAPWKTFREFIEEARTRTMKVESPVGCEHVIIAHIMKREGVTFDWQPRHAGTTENLMAGRIDAGYLSVGIAPLINAGKLRPLAYTGSWLDGEAGERLPGKLNTPSMAEIGYRPYWWGSGIVGPAGLPEPIRAKMESAIRQVLAKPEMTEYFLAAGWKNHFMSGAEWKPHVLRAIRENGKLVDEVRPALLPPEIEAW